METTLVVNPGSTSKKYSFYQDGRAVMVLRYEKVSTDYVLCIEMATGSQNCVSIDAKVYASAFKDAVERAKESATITELTDVNAVGIRVVAPGTFFQYHRIIDDDYVTVLKGQVPAAPLHVPHVLEEIESIRSTIPDVLVVGASDSAFHNTMPEMTRRYSIDHEDADRLDIFRFGYHGLSVGSIARRAPSVLNMEPERLVVVHVGGGVSVTALRGGHTFDTSMGYAPGSGLVMSSRAGDIEAGALLELMRGHHMRQHDMHMYLQTKGGLLGLAGESDLRLIMQRWAQGDPVAAVAFSKFVYHIQQKIGAYMAGMGGLDAVVFTATAAERNFELRARLLQGLSCLGIDLDEERNDRLAGSEGIITTHESPIKVAVMRTDEMGEVYRVVKKVQQEQT